jgi:hypothetical protein
LVSGRQHFRDGMATHLAQAAAEELEARLGQAGTVSREQTAGLFQGRHGQDALVVPRGLQARQGH